MSRSSIPRCLAMSCALALLSFAAHAQVAAVPADNAGTAADPAAVVGDRKPGNDRDCIRDTGSLIRHRSSDGKRDCLPVAGRSYSREDLQRSGASNAGDALRKLDPAIR